MNNTTLPEGRPARGSLYDGPHTFLRPRPEVMRGWLSYWFEFTAGSIEIAWRDTATKKITNAAHFDIRDPRLEQYAAEVNAVEGQDLYFTPSVVGNLRGRAADKDFVCSPGFWLDQDKPADIDFANTVQHEFYPTSFVYTGRTPHPRRQCWFRLEQPVRDFALVRETNAKLVDLYKGDPSVVNPARLMRLPGSIAYPWKPGRIPELVSWDHPQDQRRRSHPLSLVTSIPQAVPTLIEQRPKGNFPGVEELIHRIKAGDNWHTNMVQLVGHWVARGLSDNEILIWADEFTLKGYTSEETVDEMQTAIDGGRKAWDIPNQDHEAKTGLQGARAAFAGTPLIDTWTPIGRIAADIEPDRRPHLVRGVIKAGMTGVVHADHYVGKTTWAIGLASSVVHGRPFLGHKCQKGNVYIVELEGASLIANNLRAWHLRNDLEFSRNIIIADEPFDLFSDKSISRLKGDLRHFNEKLDGGISLVIFDTYSQLIAGETENATETGSRAAKTLKTMCDEIGATGLVVHHSNSNGDARGAKAFIFNLDFKIRLAEIGSSGTIETKYEKLKGSVVSKPDFFKIEPVLLPDLFDDDGQQIDAGVVVQVAYAEAKESKIQPESAMAATQQAIMTGAVNGVVSRISAFQNFLLNYAGSTNHDTRKRTFNRGVNNLLKAGKIKVDRKSIFLIDRRGDSAKVA